MAFVLGQAAAPMRYARERGGQAARAASRERLRSCPAAGDWLSGRAPRSHRGGHWFDPSIAHPGQRPVPIKGPAVFDLPAAADGSNHQVSQSLSLRSASRVASDGASVWISIVTAILLRLRMRMATRGCTPRAACSEPHVLRVPCTGSCIQPTVSHRNDLGNPFIRRTVTNRSAGEQPMVNHDYLRWGR